MTITPEQAREYLTELAEYIRRIARLQPSETADLWLEDADAIDRALARIAELEAREKAVHDAIWDFAPKVHDDNLLSEIADAVIMAMQGGES